MPNGSLPYNICTPTDTTTMNFDGSHDAVISCEQAGLLTVDPRNPTRAIIAALATAVAGIVPPMERHCVIRGRVATDSLWSVGAHPFGFATRDSGFSQVRNCHVDCRTTRVHSHVKNIWPYAARIASRLCILRTH